MAKQRQDGNHPGNSSQHRPRYILTRRIHYYSIRRLIIKVLQENLHVIPRSLAFPKTIYVPICDNRLPNLGPRYQQSLPAKTLLLSRKGKYLEYGDVAVLDAQTAQHHQ